MQRAISKFDRLLAKRKTIFCILLRPLRIFASCPRIHDNGLITFIQQATP